MDDDYLRQPHIRVQMQSMKGRWSDSVTPGFLPPRPPPPPGPQPPRPGRSAESRRSKKDRSPHSHHSSPPPPPSAPAAGYAFFPINRPSPGTGTPSVEPLIPLTQIESRTADSQMEPIASQSSSPTSPSDRIQELAEPQRDLHNTSSSLKLGSIIQSIIQTIFPPSDSEVPEKHILADVTAEKAESDQTSTKASTEPIVAQPYSLHSLKITELPPSPSYIQSQTDSEIKSGYKTGIKPETALRTAAVTDVPASTSTANDHRESILPLAELADIADSEFVDPDGASLNYPFTWPENNMVSPAESKSELQSNTKSLRSIQSAVSLQDTSRGPRDVDEALKSSSTLIRKMESRAKKLFSLKKDNELVDADSNTDTLLMEEDEAATSALLHKIKKHGRLKSVDVVKSELSVDESGINQEDKELLDLLELRRLKASSVKISDPTDDAAALVPYDRKVAESAGTLEASKEEPTSSGRSKRSVRYKEDGADGHVTKEDVQSVRSWESIQSTKSVHSIRSLQIKEPGSSVSVRIDLPKANPKDEKSSSEDDKSEQVKK